jgi:hypothetical protein
MVKIIIHPGDTVSLEDEKGKEILLSNYNNILSVLGEDLSDATDDDDELGDLVTYTIPEWLANDKGLQTKVSGKVKKETKKAILLKIGQSKETEDIWLPKSQITLYDPPKNS